MTELLYLPDSDYVRSFEGKVLDVGEDFLVLDRTLFYPESGGQPCDKGVLKWENGFAEVKDVEKESGDVKHFFDEIEGENPSVDARVEGVIDWDRRNKLSRMHTAQHVISRIVFEDFGAYTAGNQIYEDHSRIDFEPVEFGESDLEVLERKSNEVIGRDLNVLKEERPRSEVEEEMEGGRTNLDLIPDFVDPLRVVEIEGFDICPCGGTHVNSLCEIGGIDIVNRVSKGKNVERIEFELKR